MGLGGSQCVLDTCVSAPPHLYCRYIDSTHCETIFNGSAIKQVFHVEELSPLLERAGVRVGDFITHIDSSVSAEKHGFPSGIAEFAEWMNQIKKGDRVFVMRLDTLEREWVTL